MAPRGETKERILAKALESFSTVGYDGTSLDDLAESLGIRKQTILYHFVSKRGLLNAVLDESVKILTESLEEVLASNDPHRDRIEDLVSSVFRVAL